MKRYCLFVFFLLTIHFSYSQTHRPDSTYIFDADELINLAKNKGIKELYKKTDPLYFICLDSSYASALVDLEFQAGFIAKHPNFGKIRVCKLPELAIKAATEWNNKKAFKRLFEYYCSIPKHSKSDTIYSIYNNLACILGILVNQKSPQLIEKLKKDYTEWLSIAQTAPPNQHPTSEELQHASLSELVRIKTSNYYTDCYFITLQIASALKYLSVDGFDDSLIAELKKHQTYSDAKDYMFIRYPIAQAPDLGSPYKEAQPTKAITNFKTDKKRLIELIIGKGDDAYQENIDLLIYSKNKAHVFTSRIGGADEFIISIKDKNYLEYYTIMSMME